jgi:hypothetical protein
VGVQIELKTVGQVVADGLVDTGLRHHQPDLHGGEIGGGRRVVSGAARRQHGRSGTAGAQRRQHLERLPAG